LDFGVWFAAGGCFGGIALHCREADAGVAKGAREVTRVSAASSSGRFVRIAPVRPRRSERRLPPSLENSRNTAIRKGPSDKDALAAVHGVGQAFAFAAMKSTNPARYDFSGRILPVKTR